MTPGYVIREASPDEAHHVAEIYRTDMGKFGLPYDEEYPGRVLSAVSKAFAQIGHNRLAWLAFQDERPIGTVQLILQDAEEGDPELADGASVCHVHHLRVSYDWHRRGVGRALMETAEGWAAQLGFRRVTLGVEDDNSNALGFYAHLGYEFLKSGGIEPTGARLLYLWRALPRI